MVIEAEVRLQYLSNSGFLLTTEDGRRVVINPYLTDNAAAPFGLERIPPLELIIITHVLGKDYWLRRTGRYDLFITCNCGEERIEV